MHRPSLEERFTHVQNALSGGGHDALLAQPLSKWVKSTDRHLPQAFLGRPLREVIALTYYQLSTTPGIGNRRIAKLLDVLERACKQSAPTSAAAPEQPSQASVNCVPVLITGSTNPEDLTEAVWRSWCQAIRVHRLEHESLGRFAASLSDLPQTMWSVSLREYTDRTLQEVQTMPGHGPARVGQVLDVFSRVARTIAGCQTDSPLAVRLLHPLIRDAVLWAEDVLRNGSVPDVPAIREGFLSPLFSLLETDLGAETAAMVRRRIGLDGPVETLDQVANDVGVTRERVRQMAAKAAQVIRVRWPEGRYLLDNVYTLFQAAPGADEQLDLMHTVLDACFSLEVNRGDSRSDVLAAWDRAGRAKRTPMREASVRSWASEVFPDLPADVVRRWLEEEGLRHGPPGGDAMFFSNDPLDKLLLHLHTHPEPVPISELPDFIEGDERSVKMRIERDPRFIEDEFKRVVPAEQCSFFRGDNRWFLRLDSVEGTQKRAESVAVSDFIHMVIGGLVQVGVCDATVWGVHRFTCSLLRRIYGATLSASVTPFVLASTLVRHSDGLVRHMRRRRLRWDSADGSIPVRGKRGWVDHIASVAGVPITLEELDGALRSYFQDYESYVLKQLNLDEDEEGEANCGCQFIPGVSHVVPAIIVPREWELDLAKQNISEGVRLVVAKIVSMSTRSPFPKEYLRRLPWMVRLCEHTAFGEMRWEEGSLSPETEVPEQESARELESPPSADDTNESKSPDTGSGVIDDLLSRFL